ncbi:hypothetical protein [Vibrio maerlii]|uniref:hypothetical protein n=1 Tax=Vibrio maerlii TaxID=2231648 RepID=UPI000E3D62ED|nr:hypothetical protein [Vibrio maerlii]
MSCQERKTVLHNNKPGLLPASWLTFNLANEQISKKVGSISIATVEKIESLASQQPQVFEKEENIFWDNISSVAESCGLLTNITPDYLTKVYPVDGVDLSIDNYLRYEANKSQRAVYWALADAISKHVDLSYEYFIKKSMPKLAYDLAIECFLAGAFLILSCSEPLITAGKSRTGRATEAKAMKAYENKEKTYTLMKEYLSRRPDATNSQIAASIAPQLGLAKKTVQNYLSEMQ